MGTFFGKFDFYACKKMSGLTTLILRWGNAGHKYTSTSVDDEHVSRTVQMRGGYREACAYLAVQQLSGAFAAELEAANDPA